MKLSVTDIAFEGFRVVRDRPLALLAWVVLQFAGNLAVQPGLLLTRNAYAQLNKLGFPAMGAAQATVPITPAQVAIFAPAMGDLFEGAAIALAILVAMSAFLDPGVYRVAMAPKDRGFFSLKLGMQELRQFLLMTILFALFFGIYLTGVMGSLLFTGVFAVAGPGASMLGLAIGVTTTLCAMVYFAVRLSLAGPLTFEQNRIDVFGSWSLTRGRFYGLLGGYVVAGIMAALVYVLSVTIFLAIATVIAGGAQQAEAMFPDKPATLAAAYTPAEIFGDFYEALVGALVAAILVGARAAAFIQIRKQQPA
jgi:hypothetical protein